MVVLMSVCPSVCPFVRISKCLLIWISDGPDSCLLLAWFSLFLHPISSSIRIFFFQISNPIHFPKFPKFQSMGNNTKVLTASLLSLLLSLVLAQFEPPVGGGPPTAGKPCSSSFHCWRTEPINVFGEPVGLLQGMCWGVGCWGGGTDRCTWLGS